MCLTHVHKQQQQQQQQGNIYRQKGSNRRLVCRPPGKTLIPLQLALMDGLLVYNNRNEQKVKFYRISLKRVDIQRAPHPCNFLKNC